MDARWMFFTVYTITVNSLNSGVNNALFEIQKSLSDQQFYYLLRFILYRDFVVNQLEILR